MSRTEPNDEINLVEVLFRLWAYKFLFITTIFIFVSCSVFYLSNTPKIYTTTGIFIPENNNSAPPLAGTEVGGLAQLVGISSGISNTAAIIERFSSREFVLEVAAELELSDDQFFNSYDPEIQEPFWKAKIKSLLNWQSSSLNPAKIAERNVLRSFKEHIIFTETDTSAIQISVSHFYPERSANIANHIMARIISVLKSEHIQATTERIDYLSQRLADSLMNVENIEEKLKQFMLSQGTTATTSFYEGAIILDQLRTQQKDSSKQINTIDMLLSYAERSTPTFEDYATLRNKHPLLDQADFRRILGISENISAWSWPSVGTLTKVRASLLDRAASLNSKIRRFENEATKYAITAEEQNKLTRELKVAETMYKVLFEQVKKQSLAAGFNPDTSRIIASADTSVVETKPKKMLVLALAVVSGFVVSALLALVLSSNKSVIYSSGELLKTINPNFYHKIRIPKKYRIHNLQEAQDYLDRRPVPWLKQLFLEIYPNQRKSPIVVVDATNIHAANTIARLLAARAHEFEMSVAYFDLSKTTHIQDTKVDNQISETKVDIEVADIINGCTEYNYRSGNQNVEWLFSKSFQDTLDFLNSKYDTIIFSINSDSLDILQASGKFDEGKIVVHASKGKTTYENIQKLNKHGNIDVALLS